MVESVNSPPPVKPTKPFAWVKWVAVAIALAVLIFVGVLIYNGVKRVFTPSADVSTIATASLQGLREQRKLTAFAANFSAPATTTVTRLGLQTKKTTIFHGTVQYQVDLAKLQPGDVRWDGKSRTLSVRMPPIELSGPTVDLNNVQEYGGGGVLAKLTDSEARADAANRRAGQASMLKQARSPVLMKLARDAHRRALEASFLLPLKAAGVDAKVVAFYPEEQSAETSERWDYSRPIGEVLAN